MTNDTSPPPRPRKPNPNAPRKNPASGGKGKGSRPVQKKPGFDLGTITQKIPLPYLGGGIAALVMVLYVVLQAVMVPSPSIIQEPVQTEQPTPAVPVAETVPASASAPTPAGTPAAPPSSSASSLIPSYTGATEMVPDAPVSNDLPLIPRIADDLKQLGRDVKMTKAEFEAASTQYDTEDLDGDPFLAYRVRVPSTWTFMGPRELKDMQLNNRLMGIMALYLSPADLEMRSSLRLKAQNMAHMMSARDWAFHYALGNRYTLQSLSTYGDDRAEAIYIVTEMDISYVVRMAVVISGPRVVVAEYFVPMQKYEAEKDLQTWGITSFYLKKKDKTPSEPTKALYFFDIASAYYPESWIEQKPNVVSIDQMNASIVNMRETKNNQPGVLRGRVDVYLFAVNSDYTEIDAIGKINQQFESQNVRVGNKLGRFNPTQNLNGLEVVSNTVYQLSNPENTYQDYQYWITVLKGKNYYFYICLLTPPRSSDMYNWSRNLGAFENIAKTMKEGI